MLQNDIKPSSNWPLRLAQVYVHLIGSTFDELRAVIAKSTPKLLEIYFYHDGEIENKKWDACSIVACEIWDPDIGEELVSDIIRFDSPKSLPLLKEGEHFLYLRKEPFVDPPQKKKGILFPFEHHFPASNPIPPNFDFNYYDINAFFGAALIGEIIPSLREIFVFWNRTTILPIFVYQGVPREEKVYHAEHIIEKLRSTLPRFDILLRVELLDLPLSSPEYDPEFDALDPKKEYKMKYLGKEIPFPIVGYSRFVVFSKMGN